MYSFISIPILMTCRTKLQPIQNHHLNHKNVDADLLKTLLHETAVECPFSTFPYFYGNNSKQAQKLYKTGNCIALSLYLQDKLKKHHIKSTLIPASIPKAYQMPGFHHISHVALAIFLNHNKAYLCDPAFYFREPMFLDLNQKNKRNISAQDIYNGIPETLEYIIETQNPTTFNPFQKIDAQTYRVHTNKQDDPTDTWDYYLAEIVNPDESIGNTFLNTKKYPFITCINPHYDLETHIRFSDSHNLSIKHNEILLYQGDARKIPPDVHKIIKPCLIKHFGRSYRKIFKHDYTPSNPFELVDV